MARMSTSVLVLALASVAAAQTSILNSNSKANATYAAYNGYNATGFMDTSAYYGPYLAVNATTTEGTKPNVSISVQPEGCTILSRQFGIANYSGDLPCTLPGTPASDAKPACVVRALDALCKKVQNITGKIVLITGASTGIGRASADRLAAAGATVVGTSRYPWRYPQPPNWLLWQLDQTSDDSVKELANRMAATYGRVDFLYMNAGRQYIGDMPNSDLRQMMMTVNTNFWGALRVLQAFLPLFPTTGYARILQTSSVESQQSSPGYLPYAVSKWALMAMQEQWYSTHAAENVSTNIDYISIMPAAVNTSLGYTAIYGCPELFSAVKNDVIDGYYKKALDSHNVGEAVYRIAIDPKPKLRQMIMRDEDFAAQIPLMCRRYTQPLEEMYDGNAPGPSIAAWLSTEAKAHARYNCSAHCGGKQYCGAAASYGSIYGTDSIGAY